MNATAPAIARPAAAQDISTAFSYPNRIARNCTNAPPKGAHRWLTPVSAGQRVCNKQQGHEDQTGEEHRRERAVLELLANHDALEFDMRAIPGVQSSREEAFIQDRGQALFNDSRQD